MENILANQFGLDMEAMREALQYQGFDIKRILRNVIKAFRDYMDGSGRETHTYDINYRVDGQDKVFKCVLICVLFLIRGSTFEKYKKKSNKGLDDLTGILAVKYNIDTNLRPANSSVDPDLITILRLIACFPMQACELLQEGIG